MEPRDYPYAVQGQPMAYGECSAEPRRKRPSPERTRELMALAQGISAQVEASVPPGPERCLLRQMVEMFLDQ